MVFLKDFTCDSSNSPGSGISSLLKINVQILFSSGDGVYRLLSHQPLFLSMCGGTSLCGSKSASDIQICSGSLRKTKTDTKDAMTIAQFLLNNEKKLCVVTSTQDAQDLRDLARERESQSWMIASLKNDLKRLLQSTFPELETLRKNIYTETMLNIVRQYPSTRLIR